MGTPNVARIALIIKEAWNPVRCHGNKTVKLIFNQFYQKWVECMTSSFGQFAYIESLNIFGTKNDI